MPNLVFIRSATCLDCWDYYETKTDVWVFGDVEGYDSLRQDILKATGATENIHLTLLERHATSMRGVVLPAKGMDSRRPRLKFIERFIPDKSGPNMELVIFGNQAGYRYLADKIAKLMQDYLGRPSEHLHLDDHSDPHLLPRSVALNLRGPVQKWGRKSLAEHGDLVYSKSVDFLPSALDHRVQQGGEYEEISAEESEFLKL